MKIYKITNNCGGFKPTKKKLDTQLFPECEGTEQDRDVVKKHRKRKKKNIKVALMSWPMVSHDKKGIYDQWITNQITDKEFVEKTQGLAEIPGWPGLPDDVSKIQIEMILDHYNRGAEPEWAAKLLAELITK